MIGTLKFKDEYETECADLLESNNAIQEFHTIVTNSNYSVYAISGGWGTGKTCFVKMWLSLLASENKKYAYIDAFREDYETEPFLMLVSAFNSFFKDSEDKKKEIIEKIKKIFSIKNIMKLGLNILVDKAIGIDVVNEHLNTSIDSYFDTISEEKTLYNELSSSLEKIISDSNNLPAYIIIDELDRCRPDFALETLERIKHIFHIKGTKFILVYNEEIIKSMIKVKYGIEDNADKYLHKIIQKTYVFDNAKQLNRWYINEVEKQDEKFASDNIPGFLTRYNEAVLNIKKAYSLSLRDIQQVLRNLKQYDNVSGHGTIATIVCIEFLKHINIDEYKKMYYNFIMNIGNNTKVVATYDIFNRIYDHFKGHIVNLPESPNESVYDIMDYYYRVK